jgi:4-hydroxyphenylpyruvate dioxygenase
VEQGAKVVKDLWEEKDEHGTVRMAMVQTYGDTTHTFIDRSAYTGLFLPGFIKVAKPDPINALL